jgi:hypothetical protein
MAIELDTTTVELGIRWTWTLGMWRMAEWAARWPVSENHAPLRHHHARSRSLCSAWCSRETNIELETTNESL